jgi:CheY-like chemotaxis protein
MAHLTNAMEGATRAAALTRRLLSFARSEPLLPERVDSGELVAGMSDLLDRTLGERIQVEVDRAPDTWPTYVDPHQLENAIVNLAVNARDAMDGTGVMHVSTTNVTLKANEVGDVRPGEYVRISVTDTGCGMTPEVLERAFEPFFTTKPVGKGTTVSIYLPRTESAAEAVRLHPAVQRSEGEAHVPGARILLVEDDPRVRAATVGALEDLDYDPVACASGAEAIKLFESREFDLVISDVIMPEMTGPELIRHLKSTHGDFAVLFVTGYVGDGETDHLVGYELLRKPFTVGALANAVASALSRRASARRRTSATAAKG